MNTNAAIGLWGLVREAAIGDPYAQSLLEEITRLSATTSAPVPVLFPVPKTDSDRLREALEIIAATAAADIKADERLWNHVQKWIQRILRGEIEP